MLAAELNAELRRGANDLADGGEGVPVDVAAFSFDPKQIRVPYGFV